MNKLYSFICILFLFLASACQNPSQINGQEPADTNKNTSDPETTGSSTRIGNPALDINLNGNVYLTMKNESNNLKQVTDGILFEVLTYTDADLAINTLLEDSISVNSFALGPNGEMAIVFNSEITYNEDVCYLLYATSDTETCIETNDFKIVDDLQFDANGNLFYFGHNSDLNVDQLIKWDPLTDSKIKLINQNITLTQWLVHASGSVYIIGTVDESHFFREVSSDGSLNNLLSGESVVTQFNFISSDLMMIQGSDIIFNEGYLTGNFIFDLSTNTVVEKLNVSTGDLKTLQIDEHNNVYLKDENTLLIVYPGVIHEVNTDLDKLHLFKIFNNSLYIAGQNDYTDQLIKVDLENNQPEVIVDNFEIYHLEHTDNKLYFDGLDFSTNTLSITEFDLNSLSSRIIDEISDDLIQLKVTDHYSNYSYNEIEFSINKSYTLESDIILTTEIDLNADGSNKEEALPQKYNSKQFRLDDYTFKINNNSEIKVSDTILNTKFSIKWEDVILQLHEFDIKNAKIVSNDDLRIGILAAEKEGSKQNFLLVVDAVPHPAEYRIHLNLHKIILFNNEVVDFYVHEQQDSIFTLDSNSLLTRYDQSLNFVDEIQLYIGDSNDISFVYDFNDVLVIKSNFQFSFSVYESQFVLIDISNDKPRHIQTDSKNMLLNYIYVQKNRLYGLLALVDYSIVLSWVKN